MTPVQDRKGCFPLSRRRFLVWAAGSVGCLPVLSAGAAEADIATALFNAIRRARRLGLMAPDPVLEAMALDQAGRMAEYRKVSHALGWGNGFAARLRKAGIRGPAAENLCAGQKDVRAAFAAWMNSPGHCRNMLDPEFARYGLARAAAKEKPAYIYWAMVLGR